MSTNIGNVTYSDIVDNEGVTIKIDLCDTCKYDLDMYIHRVLVEYVQQNFNKFLQDFSDETKEHFFELLDEIKCPNCYDENNINCKRCENQDCIQGY